MATLSTKDQQTLSQRGISVSSDPYGTRITLTSNGLVWLLNYLYSSRNVGSSLSLKLLKEVARFQRDKGSWRLLRFRAVRLPVYDTAYWQFTFYLEGSPPRAVLVFLSDGSIVPKVINVPLMKSGVFKVQDNQMVEIELSGSEVDKLSKEEVVVIDSGV